MDCSGSSPAFGNQLDDINGTYVDTPKRIARHRGSVGADKPREADLVFTTAKAQKKTLVLVL